MSLAIIKQFLKKNSQPIFNIYFLCNIAGWIGWSGYQMIRKQKIGFNEISFVCQNIILLIVVLLRKPHQGIDPSLPHQLVALVAFCSGVLLIGQPATHHLLLSSISSMIIVCANVFGIMTLLNLGRSFGVLIAIREVKTGGLYSLIRHPMYGTDILLRLGFIISHFNALAVIIFVASTSCYIYRAILEEKYLSHNPAYRQYMVRVSYRFIPGVF
jgi:protein-S-isoprenylcysteine O-methyltransferase Ste14